MFLYFFLFLNFCGGGRGQGDPNYFVHICFTWFEMRLPLFFLIFFSSWVEKSLNGKFQLPTLPRIGTSMVGDEQQHKQDSVELEASLATAEAEVGAVAKADQY
jgi:hypothetical protein